jgi:hypothetical protein
VKARIANRETGQLDLLSQVAVELRYRAPPIEGAVILSEAKDLRELALVQKPGQGKSARIISEGPSPKAAQEDRLLVNRCA